MAVVDRHHAEGARSHLKLQMTAQLHTEVIELTPEQWKAFCVDNFKDYLLREANKEDSGVSHSERLLLLMI